jgi:hypothetical protein
MAEMSKAEIAKFLMQGTFTVKLATDKKDGSSHVAPIWLVLDKGNGKDRIGISFLSQVTHQLKQITFSEIIE